MNTPTPCDICEHLYVDMMYKNDPTYTAECKLRHQLQQCALAKLVLELKAEVADYKANEGNERTSGG